MVAESKPNEVNLNNINHETVRSLKKEE